MIAICLETMLLNLNYDMCQTNLSDQISSYLESKRTKRWIFHERSDAVAL